MKKTKERGISMISLVMTVVILTMLTNILVYDSLNGTYMKKITSLKNDIELLREKTLEFYQKYGKLPAEIKYEGENIKKMGGVISLKNDTGDFYVIDLEAMQGITLNYGKDYEKIKNDATNASTYTDVYIINENSHNIFYVQGISIKENYIEKKYYTDYVKADETVIDLRYIDGILIPENYYYIGKYKDSSGTENIVISTIKGEDINITKTNQYIWTRQNSKLESVPNDVKLNSDQSSDEFLLSANTNKGYFKNTEGKVVYTKANSWSSTYSEEKTYTDSDGNTVTIPKGFQVSKKPSMNTVNKGLVVRDQNENEWVWVEVPKTIYTNSTYLTGATTPTSNTDYTNIEKIMQNYASDYRNSNFKDEWYSEAQHGFASAEAYNTAKNNMLKSVYDNGGFWIGRYEAGNATATANNETIASAREDAYIAANPAVIKADQIPYNYITCKQAQTLSKSLATGGKTSSLMFGIQWDLTCKFLEEKTDLTLADIKTDSTNWGNYNNSSIKLIRGKYNTIPNSLSSTWTAVTSGTKNGEMLLTTGASEETNKMNIYDFAGNEWEWNLEYNNNSSEPCVFRGGSCYDSGSSQQASGYYSYNTSYSNYHIGFRPSLY